MGTVALMIFRNLTFYNFFNHVNSWYIMYIVYRHLPFLGSPKFQALPKVIYIKFRSCKSTHLVFFFGFSNPTCFGTFWNPRIGWHLPTAPPSQPRDIKGRFHRARQHQLTLHAPNVARLGHSVSLTRRVRWSKWRPNLRAETMRFHHIKPYMVNPRAYW